MPPVQPPRHPLPNQTQDMVFFRRAHLPTHKTVIQGLGQGCAYGHSFALRKHPLMQFSAVSTSVFRRNRQRLYRELLFLVWFDFAHAAIE